MKIAYLILAHDNPEHLQRLITALSSSSSSFYIHIDKKSNIAPFLSIKGNHIHLTYERASVYWGDFSQVDAILILLRAAVADGCHFDRFVLLSGADYPLRSAASIGQFFESNRDREFMNLVA
ncbi:MAG: beta-1,6-N-acetylglucosaminyltransferase, partial [Oxalobacteraceae bacterium]